MRRRDRAKPLATRVFVGIALAALGLACLWAGTWAFAALVAVTAALAWREWARLHHLPRIAFVHGALNITLLILIATLAFTDWTQTWLLFAWLPLFTIIPYEVREKERWSIQIMPVIQFIWQVEWFSKPFILGLLYVGVPALGLVWLDAQPNGINWVEWTVGIVCAADIAAFACGRLIGGPKLWPALSPNKTWAGFTGALLAAAAASAALGGPVGLAPAPALAVGFALGALAMGGDLFESWMKRRVGRKDSGSILPGHGGVLDRLDGLVPVATVVPACVALGWL